MPPDNPSSMPWREVLLVSIFGAFGGFLSWVLANVGPTSDLLDNPVLDRPWFIALPAAIAFGVGAAYLGVYLIANADPRALPRFFGFALLCGMAWAPTFDAGKALIQRSNLKKANEAQVSSVRRLSNGSPDQFRKTE
jgi:H+/Cl- antiporter ClcA